MRHRIVRRWLVVISTSKSIPVFNNPFAAGVHHLMPLQMTIDSELGYAVESVSIPITSVTGTTAGISAIFLRVANAVMLPYLEAVFPTGQ